MCTKGLCHNFVLLESGSLHQAGPPLLIKMTKVFRSFSHKDAVYRLMLDSIDCGPFDGGCLVFAQALQCLHGGDVAVVEGRSFSGWAAFRVPEYNGSLLAQHAVLALPDGTYMDASGRCTKSAMLIRTARLSRHVASADDIRPLQDGDLEDAARDGALVTALAQLLADPPSPSSKPSIRPRA